MDIYIYIYTYIHTYIHTHIHIHTGTGHSPTQKQMVLLLSQLSSLRIRGGFHEGIEVTFIDNVHLIRGPHSANVLTSMLAVVTAREEEKEIISRAPFAAKRYGIGIVFSPVVQAAGTPEEKQIGLIVKRLVPGGPAAINGQISPGDFLRTVNAVEVWAMPLQDVAEHLVGTMGTTVWLTFKRQDGTSYEARLYRDEIRAEPVKEASKKQPKEDL
jgi:hypothetical protein